MFNVSIHEYFSILNVYIICIRNTARSKSNPLMCTHVDSYMFSILHPLGFNRQPHAQFIQASTNLEIVFSTFVGLSPYQIPWARSHLHSVGPRPSHASFTAQSSPCSLHARAWELFLVGTNVTINLFQNYKYSSWHTIKWRAVYIICILVSRVEGEVGNHFKVLYALVFVHMKWRWHIESYVGSLHVSLYISIYHKKKYHVATYVASFDDFSWCCCYICLHVSSYIAQKTSPPHN